MRPCLRCQPIHDPYGSPSLHTFTVFGASGYTGGLVCDVLSARGHAFVAAGRDEARVRRRVRHLDGLVDVVVADVHEPDSLRAMLTETSVVVSTVGPFTRLGRPVLEAAVATGTHYVDSTGELPFLRWAHTSMDGPARAAGITAVPAAGYDFLLGDLLAAIACGAVTAPRELHVTYLVRARGRFPGFTTSGTRSSVAEVIGQPSLALAHGRQEEEAVAEQRRLAWFPKPVGPHHAAGFPGGEPLTVPRHVHGLETVRTYLAIPSFAAELFQAVGTLARNSTTVHRGLARLLRSSTRDPSPEQRAKVRWACVAEALGADGNVARAWANGTDIYAFTAAGLALVAEALTSGSLPAGVVAPAEVVVASDALDQLAARAGIRWSVKRPDPE